MKEIIKPCWPNAKEEAGYQEGYKKLYYKDEAALALRRYLGASCPTVWLIQRKLMEAMSDRETHYTLSG